MTSGFSKLQLQEEDVLKILAAQAHIGHKDVDYQMEQYVWKRKPKNEASSIINIRKMWEKLVLAARAIVAVENPADVCVISCRNYGQRAVLKYAKYTGATPIAGRFTPGSFTNQIQAAFKEPRLIVVTDPHVDHQAVNEASFVNIPVIAFSDVNTPLPFIDIVIPCNTRSVKSIGLMWWFLTREVLRLKGQINRQTPWEVMVDLFFYRDPEEAEKEEQTGTGGGLEAETQIQNVQDNYYEDTSMMPDTAGFSGNAENWGASAETWGTAPATGSAEPAIEWGTSGPAVTGQGWQ